MILIFVIVCVSANIIISGPAPSKNQCPQNRRRSSSLRPGWLPRLGSRLHLSTSYAEACPRRASPLAAQRSWLHSWRRKSCQYTDDIACAYCTSFEKLNTVNTVKHIWQITLFWQLRQTFNFCQIDVTESDVGQIAIFGKLRFSNRE